METDYIFETGGSSSNLGHSVEYRFDWGNGTHSGWLPSGTASKAWVEPGQYNVKSQARCVSHNSVISDWSDGLVVNIFAENVSVPAAPVGPFEGINGTPYIFSIGGSSSNCGHTLQYKFDWGDGTTTDWLPVGVTTASKSWSSPNTYIVTGRARCAIHLARVSNWSEAIAVDIKPKPIQITINTVPSELQISIDDQIYSSPQSFTWTQGSSHKLSVPSPQDISLGSRYVFSSWSDGESQTHTIETPSSPTTYIAKFKTQYALTTLANPIDGGTVSPSGTTWYNSGKVVTVSAKPNTGCSFSGWSGDLAGKLNPISITMNAPKDVTANFSLKVTLLDPNGGEAIPSGSIYPVSWRAPFQAEKFKLMFSMDRGVTWSKVGENLTGTTYDWQVPMVMRRDAF